MKAMSARKSNTTKRKESPLDPIYAKSLITQNITIPIANVGKGIQSIIEKAISLSIEGRCIVEGFVKPGSVKIVTHSCGVVKGTNIVFEVVFECETCFPVEGMKLKCVAKNITKAGIRAESLSDTPSPVIVFITRDHHYDIPAFSEVAEGDIINVKVIGQRFELNDKYVSIIAEMVDYNKESGTKRDMKIKPVKLVISGDDDEGIGKGNDDINKIVEVESSDDEKEVELENIY
jgi:DNA-directed RNA polymerase subunit E'/Rpb7